MKVTNTKIILVAVVVLAVLACIFAILKLHTPTSIPSDDAKVLLCGGIPNGSTQNVIDTTRLFINLPKDVYPDKDHNLQFKTVSGNATAGYISNGGLPGFASEATPACWSYYNEFDGNGEVDLTVKSAIKDMPDYIVHFIVRPNPQDVITAPTK
ncbi:MAG: hypothetical protein WAN50_04720 [Minisyncoccia bacterium]